MKISIIRKEKDEKFYTRTELVTIYKNIIYAKYADEVNKVKKISRSPSFTIDRSSMNGFHEKG